MVYESLGSTLIGVDEPDSTEEDEEEYILHSSHFSQEGYFSFLNSIPSHHPYLIGLAYLIVFFGLIGLVLFLILKYNTLM